MCILSSFECCHACSLPGPSGRSYKVMCSWGSEAVTQGPRPLILCLGLLSKRHKTGQSQLLLVWGLWSFKMSLGKASSVGPDCCLCGLASERNGLEPDLYIVLDGPWSQNHWGGARALLARLMEIQIGGPPAPTGCVGAGSRKEQWCLWALHF